jgi:alpha-tubulin suppressor-like RCC1 family protein
MGASMFPRSLVLMTLVAGCHGNPPPAFWTRDASPLAAVAPSAMPDGAARGLDASLDIAAPTMPDGAAHGLDATPDIAAQPATCKFVQVSTDDHTCAVTEAGALWCWGADDEGQAGDLFKTALRPVPGLVSFLSGPVAEVTAGYGFTCARLRDGGIRCWGKNDSGQLGDGTKASSVSPVSTRALDGQASSVSAGWYHAAAALSDGSIVEWGHPGYVAPGGPTLFPSPVPVKGAGGPIARVWCGWVHSCALARDGSLWCWGDGDGLGTVSVGSPTAVKVPLPMGVMRASAGVHETCAVLADGSLWCWGRPLDQMPQVRQPFTSAVKDVCVGQNFGCALRTDGSVWCWGQNDSGELGDSGPASTGRRVTALAGRALQIDCAVFHACAVLEDGTVSCWGDNTYASAGTGPPSRTAAPAPVSCPRL